MLAYPNVRVQANENSVWQRTISQDSYTFDVGMRPTEMFMRFNDNEFITYDGSSLEVTTVGANPGLILNGYMNLKGISNVAPGFYLYNSSNTFIGGFYSLSDNIVAYATNRLTLTSATNDIRLSGIAVDNTEDYVVAVDNSSGRLSKRSVASINNALTTTSGNLTVTGDLTVAGNFSMTDTQWEDLRAPATGINPPGQEADPDWDLSNIGWLFDASGIEVLHIIMQMPHSWKQGSNIRPHIHWQPTTTNTGGVYWRMKYKWTNVGDTDAGSWTTIYVVDPGDGTAYKHQIAAFEEIVGTGKTISSILSIEISRQGGEGTDTYTADALFKEFDIHYEVDSNGSDEEYVK